MFEIFYSSGSKSRLEDKYYVTRNFRHVIKLYLNYIDPYSSTNVMISGIHIFPIYGNHSCHEDPMAQLKRELEKAKQEIREYERNKIKVPSKH